MKILPKSPASRFGLSFCLALFSTSVSLGAKEVPQERMQQVYEEVKTPYKYGIILNPEKGKMLDCPNVFRFGDKWYMMYVQFEPKPAEGYTTQLAESDDLLNWKPLGTILDRGAEGTWDSANAGAGVAFFDKQWGGSNTLEKHEGRYWLSYLGGNKYGYEETPLSIGLASTDDPSKPKLWKKEPAPIMKPDDADAHPGEAETLYKSYIMRDETRSLGAPFVMFYNAKPSKKGDERIFAAVSEDLKTWKRYGTGAVIDNPRPPGFNQYVISGDPQIVRMNDLWVMFYFGHRWKPYTFDTFAASYDLVNWTKWNGEDLVKPSEPFDTPYAHKPWVIKHDGVVYHFYCAVDKKRHRAIAVATSKDFKKE
ncbi:MAG: hypothetical protein QM627_08550 [Luteolibacter sp.]